MDDATQTTRTDLTSAHAKRRSSGYVILLCCVAAIGGFLFGFDSGVINGTVDALAKAFGTNAAGTGFAVRRCRDAPFGDEQDAEHSDQQDGGLKEQRRGIEATAPSTAVRPVPPRSRASTTTATNDATSPPRLSTSWAA